MIIMIMPRAPHAIVTHLMAPMLSPLWILLELSTRFVLEAHSGGNIIILFICIIKLFRQVRQVSSQALDLTNEGVNIIVTACLGLGLGLG